MTREADVGLARARRALDGEVGVVGGEQGGLDGVEVAGLADADRGERPAGAEPGQPACQQVDAGRAGQVVTGVDDPLGHLREGLVDRPGAQHLRRDQRDGHLEVVATVLGLQLLDEQGLVQPAVLGEPVDGLEDRDGGAGARVGVAGQRRDAGRRRVDVDRAHLVAGAGGMPRIGSPSQPQGAPWPLARGRPVPRLDDLGRLDEEHPVGHPPVADRQPQPLEVGLPHRLVLAGVEQHRRGDQGDAPAAPVSARAA